jgi:hypothetical protein
MSNRSIHDKYYVRTPDLSVYGDSANLINLKPKTAISRSFRVPVHASPLKYRG